MEAEEWREGYNKAVQEWFFSEGKMLDGDKVDYWGKPSKYWSIGQYGNGLKYSETEAIRLHEVTKPCGFDPELSSRADEIEPVTFSQFQDTFSDNIEKELIVGYYSCRCGEYLMVPFGTDASLSEMIHGVLTHNPKGEK